MTAELYINRCQCGWQFLAFNAWTKKCPQCRDIIQTCINCGCEINGLIKKRYCDNCRALNKKVIDKYNMQAIRNNIKESIGDICNYDCFNCKFSDCIQPAEKEEQGELF